MFHIKNPLLPIRFRFNDEAYLETRQVFCEELLSQNELLEELRQEKYDVGLISLYDSCGVGLLYLIGIQSVNCFSATPMTDILSWQLGIPMPPSYLTDTFNWDIRNKNFGFFERLSNIWYYTELMFDIDYINYGEQQVFEAKIPGFPNLRSLIANLTYIFLNTNELLDMSRPVTAKVKYIGGIAMGAKKSLNEEFESFLSLSSKGTVLFSFGSLAKTSIFPLEVKLSILRAFSQFPEFTFIWKYDDIEKDKELFKNFSNVFLAEWLPQIDLLNDKRVKAFITHMGLNSYLETSFAGVPVVAIPLFGDQMQNAESAERLGFC
uniref:glucuronosyltransferase n=1 Tax=Acrobeloides nanus TaxID=290746 RepID=A0A914EHU7_9BILA